MERASQRAGLPLNKSEKRTDEQLIGWLKAHPEKRYHEIPSGIRNKLEEKYGSIASARKAAGLVVTDWRSSTKRRRYAKPANAGRPVEYTKEIILEGLISLAVKLGRPPRIKDIGRKECGFTPSSVFARFGTLNAALQAASLPIMYSHSEYAKIIRKLETIMMNIKMHLGDIPLSFNMGQGDPKPLFSYPDHEEFLELKRSSIAGRKYPGNAVVWFLVDDSIDNVPAKCLLDLEDSIPEKLFSGLMELRKQFDEISMKYVGQPLLM